MDTHASYRHVQPFTALWVLLPLSTAATVMGVVVSQAPNASYTLAPALAIPLLLLLLMGRLVIELRGERLHWGFGFVGWPRWSVALAEIERLESTRARALQGAGVKGPRRHRLYNVTLGGPALQLGLKDGRTVTLGTPDAARLRAFIEARMPHPLK